MATGPPNLLISGRKIKSFKALIIAKADVHAPFRPPVILSTKPVLRNGVIPMTYDLSYCLGVIVSVLLSVLTCIALPSD